MKIEDLLSSMGINTPENCEKFSDFYAQTDESTRARLTDVLRIHALVGFGYGGSKEREQEIYDNLLCIVKMPPDAEGKEELYMGLVITLLGSDLLTTENTNIVLEHADTVLDRFKEYPRFNDIEDEEAFVKFRNNLCEMLQEVQTSNHYRP